MYIGENVLVCSSGNSAGHMQGRIWFLANSYFKAVIPREDLGLFLVYRNERNDFLKNSLF